MLVYDDPAARPLLQHHRPAKKSILKAMRLYIEHFRKTGLLPLHKTN